MDCHLLWIIVLLLSDSFQTLELVGFLVSVTMPFLLGRVGLCALFLILFALAGRAVMLMIFLIGAENTFRLSLC